MEASVVEDECAESGMSLTFEILDNGGLKIGKYTFKRCDFTQNILVGHEGWWERLEQKPPYFLENLLTEMLITAEGALREQDRSVDQSTSESSFPGYYI